jgi:ATP-binding cassette subfamily F protein uup
LNANAQAPISLLSAHHLHKSYGTHSVLADISFTLSVGERVGLVGNNGSGKSTLAKIVAGVETPDQGQLMRKRSMRVGILNQVPDADLSLSAHDAVALGLAEWRNVKVAHDRVVAELADAVNDSARTEALLLQQAEFAHSIEQLGGWDQEHRIDGLLQHLGVNDVHAPLQTRSGGELRRIALAQQLLAQPDLLVLDEPTNHLDTAIIEWLETYLTESFPGALLVITHDRYFLDRVVTRTLELSQGTLTSYAGGWEQYLLGKAEREALQARTEANRQNFLRREIEWLRRQPKARGTKQKARIQRAEGAIEDAPTALGADVKLSLGSERQGSSVLEFKDVDLEVGGRLLVQGLNLILGRKRRVGIIGANGCGKTSLLRLVMTGSKPQRGEVVLGKTTRIAYLDQTRSGLVDDQSIIANVSDAPRVRFGGDDVTIFNYLERFNFRGEQLQKRVGMLSGGERARVALAKLLLNETNLLILDEPTNDLDVSTLGALEEMLVDFEGSALIVTHDRYFLNRVATDVLAFEGQGSVVHVVGNYDNYMSLRGHLFAQAQALGGPQSAVSAAGTTASAPPNPATTAKPPERARAVKLSYSEQRELDGLLPAIEAAEAEVARLEAALSDPDLYKSGASAGRLLDTELAGARKGLETKLARWEELESKRERFERERS